MTPVQWQKLTGWLLILTPILINIPYTILVMTFDYPDILRQAPGEVLTRYQAGGATLLLTWWAFAIVGLPLVLAIIALRQLMQRPDTPYLQTATTIGVVGALVQMVGLLRWTFVVPTLAQTYTDPSTSESTRAATMVTFQAIHQYGGVALGEHMGQLFTVVWMVLVSLAMFNSPLFRPWLAWFGMVAALVYLLAQTELFATVMPHVPVVPQAGLIGSLLWLAWLITTGVFLVRPPRRRSETVAPHAAPTTVSNAGVSHA
ncbi:MAG: DUF4386 domain-containing protein [Chloroflexota bacterium]|nr:DUF4386 domain-containing protein [Chloroflexota bacterium]